MYWRVVTKRLEKVTFMKERVLKIPVFLTSSGYTKIKLNSKLSGNELYTTNYLESVVNNMLCSEVHC